ncbi:MAG: phosphatidylinositol mannoside acyltransferase [Actinomycetes bacterium]
MHARQRTRITIFKTLATAMELAPERVDRWIGEQVAGTVGRLSVEPRNNLRSNVRRALGTEDLQPSSALLERYVDRGFETYGRYWAEGAKLPAISKSNVNKNFCFAEGLEHLQAAAASGRGVVIAIPHIGSWEWGGAFLANIGLPMHAVAEALDPPELFEWFAKKRRAIGIEIAPLNEQAGTILLSTIKAGKIVGLLCDRDIQNNGIPARLLGEDVTIPAGPATLALRTGAVLLAGACYAGPGDGHHAVFSPPIAAERLGKLREDVSRVTQLVADELSGLIRRAPEQWHVLQPRFDTP